MSSCRNEASNKQNCGRLTLGLRGLRADSLSVIWRLTWRRSVLKSAASVHAKCPYPFSRPSWTGPVTCLQITIRGEHRLRDRAVRSRCLLPHCDPEIVMVNEGGATLRSTSGCAAALTGGQTRQHPSTMWRLDTDGVASRQAHVLAQPVLQSSSGTTDCIGPLHTCAPKTTRWSRARSLFPLALFRVQAEASRH